MAHDGVFTDDASDAVDALEQQVFGPKGVTPEAAGARLSEVGVIGPDGQAVGEAYEYRFDPDTAPDQLVQFALSILRALGYQEPAVMWNWLARAKDQVPR